MVNDTGSTAPGAAEIEKHNMAASSTRSPEASRARLKQNGALTDDLSDEERLQILQSALNWLAKAVKVEILPYADYVKVRLNRVGYCPKCNNLRLIKNMTREGRCVACAQADTGTEASNEKSA